MTPTKVIKFGHKDSQRSQILPWPWRCVAEVVASKDMNPRLWAGT
jgi:hypothetical protein